MSNEYFLSHALKRRKFLGTAGAAAGAVLASSMIPGCTTSAPSSNSSPAAGGDLSIPEAKIRMGAVAYTNHAWTVLAEQAGFLKDVGLAMDPPTPKILLDQQCVPQLQNKELDITTMFFGLIVQALDKVTNVKPILVYSYWQGNTILTAPDSGFKTVDDFLQEGMPWDEAAKAAMAQLKGQQLTVPPNQSTAPWLDYAFSFADLKKEDAQLVALEDPKAVQLALAGRSKFASPSGAVQIYQLQFQNGWRPVMSTLQMVKNIPGGTNTPVNNVLNYDVIQCTQEYYDQNHDTVLRFVSAMYRTMDYMFGPKQEEALTSYAPFINANTGAQLDAKAIKFIFEQLDPFFTWENQSKVWEDTSFPLYYKNLYTFQVQKYIENGTIANKDYDLDQTFLAKTIWTEMRQLQQQSDQLIEKAKTASLSAEKQALFDKGKTHYDHFNFLDAARFMEAALA
jgi:ABC-type nitrate/sulfonate/bicarbonate transport system substrate-binding protein